MNGKLLLALALGLTVYLILGGVFFSLLEGSNEEDVATDTTNFTAEFLANNPCMTEKDLEELIQIVITAYDNGIIASNNETDSNSNWDIASSVFFAMTVVTTIGYGHISPATSGGRIFFAFYAIIGIPICLILLSGIGEKLTNGLSALNMKCSSNSEETTKTKSLRIMLTATVGIVLFVLIPAVIFTAVEDWSYGTSLYYVMVTLSTVGFGDYVPGLGSVSGGGRGIYRIACGVWIIIGLAWLSTIISQIQECFTKSIKKRENTALFSNKKDISTSVKVNSEQADDYKEPKAPDDFQSSDL